ncbi:MAG: riboflavin biosynthesis protein RibF [Eubacterium sp.]|nr:riboflavin biosynthesis protein RibF [Eubacterium sp.]
MEIIRSLDFNLNKTAVCIGKFDGIHKGHRLLIQKARETGLPVVMFTFQMDQPTGIYTPEEKVLLAESAGVDILITITVTEEFMHMSAYDFIDDILCSRCGAREVFVGEDFAFGYQRSGTAAMLKAVGPQYGFVTNVFPKLRVEDKEVSSTRIRGEISQGNMELVGELMATPYFIRGQVVSGNQIGRTIDVPTANILLPEGKILPPQGVYAVFLEHGGKVFKGVGNLGTKPTISGQNPLGLEISIFDFHEDIYGEEITVYLTYYIRPEEKFDSLEELRMQIEADQMIAEDILAEQETEGSYIFLNK